MQIWSVVCQKHLCFPIKFFVNFPKCIQKGGELCYKAVPLSSGPECDTDLCSDGAGMGGVIVTRLLQSIVVLYVTLTCAMMV